MAIKIRKKNKKRGYFQYKSFKKILTPQDIKQADEFDLHLNETIKEIEKILLGRKIISRKSKKKDPLQVWYIIGKHINKFLRKYPIVTGEEDLFWNYLYGRSLLIHKGVPRHKVGQTRNDFKTASLLARYPFKMVRKVGPWALWREIIGYRTFLKDERILRFIINELIKKPRTRDEARPFLKSLAGRFKKIDTSILNDKELLKMLKRK